MTILQIALCGLVSSCLLVLGPAVPSLRAQNAAPPAATGGRTEANQGDASLNQSAAGLSQLRAQAEVTPPLPGAERNLGVALYRSGKLVEAVKVFTRAEALDPLDVESIQLHGLALYRLGQPAAAIPFLERVKQFTPDANADAQYVLGLCFLNAQQYDKARASFAGQFGVGSESAAAYLLLAQELIHANLPELASSAAEQALQHDARLPLAHFLRGEVALFKSELPLAQTEFEAERALNPAYPVTYERLGDLNLRAARYEQAQDMLMKALSLDTSSTGPFLLMGKVLLRRNDPLSSLLYLEHAERMDPASLTAHTLLSQAYRSLGQTARAEQETETVSHLNASHQLKLQPVQ